MFGRRVCFFLLFALASPTFGQAAPTAERVRSWVLAGDFDNMVEAGPAVMDHLVALYRESDPETRTQIAHHFYRLGLESEAARQAMWPDLDTEDTNLRLAVQWAIGRVSDDDRVAEALIARMLMDPNPLFREKAACGLASDQIHLSDAQNYRLNKKLIELLESPELEVRALVIRILHDRTGKYRGFRPHDPPELRAKALEDWRSWIARWGSPAAALEGKLVAAPPAILAAEADITPLRSMPFEAEEDAGPDTFQVIQNARGAVTRTPLFRQDGHFSVEIRDIAADGDFPELQGFFDLRTHGRILVHFALLVVDPTEELNIGLAGPARFTVARDGLAVWLKVNEGRLFQISDQQPRALLDLQPFTWYLFDLVYDIDTGRYDLRIEREGAAEAEVKLQGQRNAPGLKNSGVELISFIGDTGNDRSSTVYYVDDIQIAALEKVELGDLVAPGRRQLFVELFGSERAIAGYQFGCFQALEGRDLGIDSSRLNTEQQALLEQIVRQTAPDRVALEKLAELGQGDLAAALGTWQQSCATMSRPQQALQGIEAALALAPEAQLYQWTKVGALARLGQFSEAEELLAAWTSQDDPRPAILASMLKLAARNAQGAVELLEPWQAALDKKAEPSADRLVDPMAWQKLRAAWVAEQQFFNLMRARRFTEAVALAVQARETHQLEASRWREREADASLLAGNAKAALELYRQLAEPEPDVRVALKMADAFFLLGDRESERRLREQVYGKLASAEP